eukprot:scaffold176505_cov23-Cyclotella_meneghiniana.AAC.1
MATLIGESGNMLEVMLELIFGKPFKKKENNDDDGGDDVIDETESNTNDNATLDIRKQSLEIKGDTTFQKSSISSNTTEKKQQLQQQQQQPRHSVRDALRQSSTLEDFVVIDDNGNVEHSMEFMAEYVQDFKTMLEQGLYVFFSVKERYTKSKSITNGSFDGGNYNSNNNGNNFRLGVFSYDTHNHGGVFLITPVGAQETNSNVATLPIYGLTAPLCSGSQSIILEWRGETMASVVTDNAEDDSDSVAINVKAEIVLSNEDDRGILYNCLTKCLPWMRA